MRNPIIPSARRLAWGAAAVSIAMGCWHLRAQSQERRFLRALAEQIVSERKAEDGRSKVLALRDYLRAHVSWRGVPQNGRPLLRDSAVETIRSGRGWCGEGSRAFVALAREVGLPAQRVILTGATPHVVAEAEVAPGQWLIVDSQEPPMVADLEPLDAVIARPQFDDYYSVNLERLHVTRFVTRIRLVPGPLTYFLESPKALLAALWFSLAGASLLVVALGPAYGWLLRRIGSVPPAS